MLEIGSLDPGDRVDAPLAVRTNRGLAPYADGFYLTLELGNATGELPAKAWLGPDEDAAQQLDATLDTGDVIQATGRVTEYRGRLEVSIEGPPERLAPDAIDPSAFVPTSQAHLGRILREVLARARAITDDALRELVLDAWTDETLQARLVEHPATKRHHRAHLGGLIEHVHALLVLAEGLIRAHPGLDRDLLTAAILLTAPGKLDEHSVTASIEITDAGRLLGPTTLADDDLRTRLDAAGLHAPRALRLRHAVLAHRGRGEGSPVAPRTPEALAMRELARLDVRLARTLEAADRMRSAGEVSGWAEETRAWLDVWQPEGPDALDVDGDDPEAEVGTVTRGGHDPARARG